MVRSSTVSSSLSLLAAAFFAPVICVVMGVRGVDILTEVLHSGWEVERERGLTRQARRMKRLSQKLKK